MPDQRALVRVRIHDPRLLFPERRGSGRRSPGGHPGPACTFWTLLCGWRGNRVTLAAQHGLQPARMSSGNGGPCRACPRPVFRSRPRSVRSPDRPSSGPGQTPRQGGSHAPPRPTGRTRSRDPRPVFRGCMLLWPPLLMLCVSVCVCVFVWRAARSSEAAPRLASISFLGALVPASGLCDNWHSDLPFDPQSQGQGGCRAGGLVWPGT